jgi:hypothetical protein
MALALLVCLATVLWCILLSRRQRHTPDRIMTGLLGLIVIYDGLRILKDSGFSAFGDLRIVQGWVDLISACLYLTAALILKTSGTDRAATKIHLRLMEANEKPVDLSGAVMAAVAEMTHPLVDSSPVAIFAIDGHGIVTYWNTASETLIGWARAEIVGHELPFDPAGRIRGKNGKTISAAVWTSGIRSLQGHSSGRMFVAAGEAALRQAGIELVTTNEPREFVPG